jgi:hypothetical protein
LRRVEGMKKDDAAEFRHRLRIKMSC